jgi:hypothetical protein
MVGAFGMAALGMKGKNNKKISARKKAAMQQAVKAGNLGQAFKVLKAGQKAKKGSLIGGLVKQGTKVVGKPKAKASTAKRAAAARTKKRTTDARAKATAKRNTRAASARAKARTTSARAKAMRMRRGGR